MKTILVVVKDLYPVSSWTYLHQNKQSCYEVCRVSIFRTTKIKLIKHGMRAKSNGPHQDLSPRPLTLSVDALPTELYVWSTVVYSFKKYPSMGREKNQMVIIGIWTQDPWHSGQKHALPTELWGTAVYSLRFSLRRTFFSHCVAWIHKLGKYLVWCVVTLIIPCLITLTI